MHLTKINKRTIKAEGDLSYKRADQASEWNALCQAR